MTLKDLLTQANRRVSTGASNIAGSDVSVGLPRLFDMIKARASEAPGYAETILPALMALLSPEGQQVSPFAQAIARGTEQNVAAAQSDAMKRGLTGSDIEMAGMQGARAQGQQALSQLYGQTAGNLSNAIMSLLSQDIQTQQGVYGDLASAIGEEFTAQRDIRLQKEAQDAAMKQAKRNQWMSLAGSALGAGGNLMGAGMMSKAIGKAQASWPRVPYR